MSDALTRDVFVVGYAGEDRTVRFAADELARYLRVMLADDVEDVRVISCDSGEQDCRVSVGIDSCLREKIGLEAECPEVDDRNWDDAVDLAVEEGRGYVSGDNPRSVLIAVYRFLHEVGCQWLRPGPGGERVPRKAIGELSAKVSEAASYRHRAICIEGAVSYANVVEIIDWAPRLGFNGYFTQFRESYTFFDRWYSHAHNPLKAREPFSPERAREFMAGIRDEIDKRGLLYHAVGHGWTCEPLGISGLGWDPGDYTLTPETESYLAEVKGERAIWKGVPLNTNLCYSHPKVRRLVVESIADYVAENPDIDLLHFWLADGSNNQCECAKCRAARPSDFYVMMLNELDEVLTQRGIDTRIVFLIYVDLLWAPERERIKNPDRFVLMFAPITRSYREPFVADAPIGAVPDYERNHLLFPSGAAENLAFLKGWQEQFGGDSFDFDYHMWRAHLDDPGGMSISRILGQDIKALRALGLNGYVSCQVQRAFFPTGLPMHVMGSLLWNHDIDLGTLEREYFAAAFGRDADQCREYLTRVSEAFEILLPGGGAPRSDQDVRAALDDVQEAIAEFGPVVRANLYQPDLCVGRSWVYLEYHNRLLSLIISALGAELADGGSRGALAWRDVQSFLQRNEDLLQPVLDVWLCLRTFERILGQ